MKNYINIFRIAFAALLLTTITVQALCEECKGIKDSHEYHDEVCFVKNNGWTDGFPDKNFKPDNVLKKGEFSAMLAKAVLENKSDDLSIYLNSCFNDNTFTDIKDSQDQWYVRAMCYLKYRKVLPSSSSSGADQYIPFYEALEMAMKAFGFNDRKPCFSDPSVVIIDKYLYSAVANNIIKKFTFFPNPSFLGPDDEKETNILGKISRGYGAYLLFNISLKKYDLNSCDRDNNERILFAGEYGATVRRDPYVIKGVNEIRYIHKNNYISAIGDMVEGQTIEVERDGKKLELNGWQMVYIDNKLGFIHHSTIEDNISPYEMVKELNNTSHPEWGKPQEAWHPFGGYGAYEEICNGISDGKCGEYMASYNECEKQYNESKIEWCPRMSSYSETVPGKNEKFERSLLGFSRRYKNATVYLKPLEDKYVIWNKQNNKYEDITYKFSGFRKKNFTNPVPPVENVNWMTFNNNVKTTCIMSINLHQVCCENTKNRFCSYAISGQNKEPEYEFDKSIESEEDVDIYQSTPRGIYYLESNGKSCNTNDMSEWTCTSFKLCNNYHIDGDKILPFPSSFTEFTDKNGEIKKIGREKFWDQMFFHPGSISHGCVTLNNPIFSCKDKTGRKYTHYYYFKYPANYENFRNIFAKDENCRKDINYLNYKWKIVLEIMGDASSKSAAPAKILIHD